METTDPIARRPTRPLARVIKIFALNLVLLSALFGAIEIYFRFTHSYVVVNRAGLEEPGVVNFLPESLLLSTPRGNRLRPKTSVIIKDHDLSGRDVPMWINSRGFRDRELSAEKGPNQWRGIVLGDSITWGSYLLAEETFVQRAEGYLQMARPEVWVELVNAGVEDLGLKEEVFILEEQGLALRPDLVVVAFYQNDSRPPWGFSGELGAQGFWRRHSVAIDALYKKLALRGWLKEKGGGRFDWIDGVQSGEWKTDRAAFLRVAGLAKYDWGAAWDPASWDVIRAELAKLKDLGAKHNFKIAVMAFPVSYQVYADFVEDEPERRLGELCREFNFPYLDLLPLFRDAAPHDPNLFHDHCHPRPPANDLVGKALANFILQAGVGP